jgi:exonuclease III
MSEHIRVSAFNVEAGRRAGANDIGKALAAFRIDIAGFSETPAGTWIEEAAAAMSLPYTVLGSYSTAGHRDKYKGIASRTPLFGFEEIPMADTLHTAVKAKTVVGGLELSIYSVHFPFGWRDQAHIDETTNKVSVFVDYLAPLVSNEATIVMGDFNFVPTRGDTESLYYEMLAARGLALNWNDLGVDTRTITTINPFERKDQASGHVIDHIMYSANRLRAAEGGIIELDPPLSDHKPVWSALELSRRDEN